jgi:hypothetical protein
MRQIEPRGCKGLLQKKAERLPAPLETSTLFRVIGNWINEAMRTSALTAFGTMTDGWIPAVSNRQNCPEIGPSPFTYATLRVLAASTETPVSQIR